MKGGGSQAKLFLWQKWQRTFLMARIYIETTIASF